MVHRTLGAPKMAYTEPACREAKYKSAACFTLGANMIAENVVGPTLGKENIRNGALSCAVGSLIVILFMMA